MTARVRFIAFFLITLALSAAPATADDTSSYTSQARNLIKHGEYRKALDWLKSGYSLYPYDQRLRHELASVYVQAGKRDLKISRYLEAADYFGQAHELYPSSKEIGVLRGVALYLDKNYDAARPEFEAAGEQVEALVYLGKIGYDTGDLPAALSYWRRALDRDPENATIARLIEKAERELPVEEKMDRGYSAMFDLSFDAELPQGLSGEVLEALESAYNTVGDDLGLFPRTRIPVLLYTKSDYRSVTAGPDWSGGLYDGKIRLPVGGITGLTKQLRAVIFHEYTHVVIAELTHGNIPSWLNEGLAEVEGHREFSRPTAQLARAVKNDTLLPLPAVTASFKSMDTAEAGLAYQQSYSMANFMVERYGWYAVQAILKSLGQRATMEAAVSQALTDWSLDLPGMINEWRESLK